MDDRRETFECGPSLRLEAQERVTALQFAQMNQQMARLEVMMERMERRLWLTVYGVVGVILAKAFQSILMLTP